MKRALFASLLLLAAGCKKNPATEYTGALKEDVTKARSAAEKADAAVSDENARTEEARKTTE